MSQNKDELPRGHYKSILETNRGYKSAKEGKEMTLSRDWLIIWWPHASMLYNEKGNSYKQVLSWQPTNATDGDRRGNLRDMNRYFFIKQVLKSYYKKRKSPFQCHRESLATTPGPNTRKRTGRKKALDLHHALRSTITSFA